MTDTYTPLPEADFSISGKIRNLSRRSLGDLISLPPPRKGKAPSYKGLLLSHLPIVLVGDQGHTELLTHGMLLRQLRGSSLENFQSLKVFEVDREGLTHEELEVLRYLSEVLPQELFNTSHVMEARAFIKQLNEKPGLEEKLARIVFGLSKPTLDIKSLMILTQGRWAKSTLQRAHSPKGQRSLDDDRGASEPLSPETNKDNEAQKAAQTSVPLTPPAPKAIPSARWQAASGPATDTTRPALSRTRQSHVPQRKSDLLDGLPDASETPSS